MHYSSKTKGIIIKRRKYQEADYILTLFTEDLGKIEVWARGVRKGKAKLQGQLGLFNLIKLELVHGRIWDVIIGAEAINTFSCLKEDFNKLVLIHFLAEFIDKFLPVQASDFQLYILFRNVLLNLDKLLHRKAYLQEFILGEFNVLNHLGLTPQFDQCIECGEELKLEGAGRFVGLGEGGIYCDQCLAKTKVSHRIDQRILGLIREVTTPQSLKLLRGPQELGKNNKALRAYRQGRPHRSAPTRVMEPTGNKAPQQPKGGHTGPPLRDYGTNTFVKEVGMKDLEEVNFVLACFLGMALPQRAKALEWLGRLPPHKV